VVYVLSAKGESNGAILMIYAIMTMLGILSLGGIMYFVLAEVWLDFYASMISLYPDYMVNPSTAFLYNLVEWLPLFILIISIISAIVIELRRKNPNEYFQI